MNSSLADDPNKNIVVYVNDFYPEFASAFKKLSEKLGRPLRGIMLIDAERKASGHYKPDKEGLFEELVVDFSNDAALRSALGALENNLLLISCDSEAGQLYFKRAIPHVPYINTPTESSIDYCTDKGSMRKLLLSYDEKISPKAVVVSDASEESVQKVLELTFPMIVKPTNLAASMLVNKVHNVEELSRILKSSFASLDEIYPRYRGLGDKTMIVEEFVEGDLFSADAYVDNAGKVYVLPLIHFQNGKMVGMDSYQVYQSETYHTLNNDEHRDGILVAEMAIRAVGLRSSVAHIELFHTSNGWKVVELGARPGGWRQEMYEISYGIDHALNELCIKIGIEPQMPAGLKTHSTTFKIHAPAVGTVMSISGIEEARTHPKMHSVRQNIKLGEVALPSTQGGEELIDGLMWNDDPEELNKDLALIRSIIKININTTEVVSNE